ncbi:hypothetical protein Cfor_06184 [Coptotermes formosanus]|uniref:Protein kinase domain-containing protein n=1 Tax=Coptotermes formosanus TaxID=36987 RepID=A0A6L2Q3Y6_COPFO|nr:hypothetical protein Cfor_06184 [Coptotermes formosanus]
MLSKKSWATVCQIPSVGREISSSVEFEPYFDAKWQIPSKNLLLGRVLGEGFFGVVRKGVLQKGGELRDVAVKMLRGAGHNYCSYCLQNHKCKNMAKSTGRTSAGCKCSNKEKLSEQVKNSELQWMENTGKCCILFQSGSMDLLLLGVDELSQQTEQLSPADLLSFARQSAKGMASKSFGQKYSARMYVLVYNKKGQLLTLETHKKSVGMFKTTDFTYRLEEGTSYTLNHVSNK